MLDLLLGYALGLSLAAPPGPVLALMADTTLRRSAGRGMLVGLGATTADFGFFLLAWAGAVVFLASYPILLAAASLAGAALLAYFAVGAWRSARAPATVERAEPATYVTGFAAAATSPFNFAWWVGPGSVLVATLGLLSFVGMFAGILTVVVAFPLLLREAGRRVRDLQRWVSYASAGVLALFAAWIAVRGLQTLASAF